MVGVAAGEMENPEREVPKAVNAVIFRIGVFYCGSILLLVSMLPTSSDKSNTSPFVTVFGATGLNWMGDVIQAVLIVAAMLSLNSGLYSTGRVLRSLGMSKQAPRFTLRMSRSGVPWAGIVMTAIVYVVGAVLNYFDPNAFETALEAAALGVLFTWGTIFLCQLRLRKLVDRGIVEKSAFQMPGPPYTSYIGLVFLCLVVLGMCVSGWQSSPNFWHKTDFLVVVICIPVLAALLAIGWAAVKPKVAEKHRRQPAGALVAGGAEGFRCEALIEVPTADGPTSGHRPSTAAGSALDRSGRCDMCSTTSVYCGGTRLR